MLARGDVQFVVNIPQGFTRDLLRGERPAILIEADATDPAATSNAIGSLRTVLTRALQHDLKGPLAFLAGGRIPSSCACMRCTTRRPSRNTISSPV